jgi:hypothetical protein
MFRCVPVDSVVKPGRTRLSRRTGEIPSGGRAKRLLRGYVFLVQWGFSLAHQLRGSRQPAAIQHLQGA